MEVQESIPAANGLSILFDESHTNNGSDLWAPGNASLFSWMLGENGYNSTTNFAEALDSGILDGHDAVVICFPMLQYTTSEISAIHDFVEDGGGLLLIGVDNENWWEFKPTNLNPIASQYGIEFNLDQSDVSLTNLPGHHITYNVDSISLDGDDLTGCSLTVSSPGAALVSESDNVYIATAESGSGRVVCVGSVGPFYTYRYRSYGLGESHFQFSLNVIDWLTGGTQRDAHVPDLAKIYVGNGPDMDAEELSEYQGFVGLLHDHTTHSPDGVHTPAEMLEVGLQRGLDFMVMSDHSYNYYAARAGITGALAMKDIVETYGLQIRIGVGAELSQVRHTLGFPLTENIFTIDQQYAIDQIHAQGGNAYLCHPTIGFNYAETWMNYDSYGFDGFEVTNRGFFFGSGEAAFYRPFYSASDGHSKHFVGQMLTVIYVENPSGPHGMPSDDEINNAITNRRVVAIDKENTFVLGERTWVDKYIADWDLANTTVLAAREQIDFLKEEGEEIGLSERFIEDAESALDQWCVYRAMKLAINATSDLALGIDFSISHPSIIDPDSGYTVSLTISNHHSFGLSINTTILPQFQTSFAQLTTTGEIAPESESTIEILGHTKRRGISRFWVNLVSVNVTEYLNPLTVYRHCVIDNVTHVLLEPPRDGYIEVRYFTTSEANSMIDTVVLHYDVGEGIETIEMDKGWDYYSTRIGPFSSGINMTYFVVVKDIYGTMFTLDTKVATLPDGGGVSVDPMLLIAGFGVAAVVLIVAVFMMKKRE